jgi:flagellar motor switch protein FliM
MSEPILAPEEVEALMAQVAPSEHAEAMFASLPPIIQPEHIDSYQFDSAEEDKPDRYPMFINLQDRLVEVLDEQWNELFNNDIQIQLNNMESSIYKDITSHETPQVYLVYEVEDFGRMLVTFDTCLIVAFVDAMLGGDGEAAGDPQALSPVEFKLCQRIGARIGDTLSVLWKPIQVMDFALSKIDNDSQFLAVTGASDLCFSCHFQLKISDDLQGRIGMHYPRSILEPILDKLRTTVSDELGDRDEEWSRSMLERLSQTPALIRFEMADCQINIKAFLALKPGDFLPVNVRKNAPCTLWVENTPMFQANAGEQDGMLAAEIIDKIKGSKS